MDAWHFAKRNRTPGKDVFGGTPNTARETRALPGNFPSAPHNVRPVNRA
jgi:hypothetical protein